jgi:hypothetical protein
MGSLGPLLRFPEWLVVALLAVLLGVSVTTSVPVVVGLATLAAAGYTVVRTPLRSEVVVGLYWIAFELYYTVFVGFTLNGVFYPFYAAFFVSLVARLLRSGLRVEPKIMTLYVGFLSVVALSFVGFTDPIDFVVGQRVLAYIFGGLTLFQFGSRAGLTVVSVAGVAASSAVSGWVIVSAAQGGFGYRGDVNIDQNVGAFLVGIGAVMLASFVISQINARARWGSIVAPVVLLGAHVYGFLLLASRGVTIALAITLVALTARAVAQGWRNLVFVVLIASVATGAFYLPGGHELIKRFESERVQSGGSRIPIWNVALETYTTGNVRELVLGRGFDSSKSLVLRHFAATTSTHNAYIEMLYEFGLVGCALFVLLHLYLIARGWMSKNGHGLVLFGITVFLLGADLTLNVPDGFVYWITLGFAMALATWGDDSAGTTAS